MPQEKSDTNFRLPLSGSVNQSINPWQWVTDWRGGQVSMFNVDLGRSGDPTVESDVLDKVGSYGRQLGRIGEVLEVLLDRLPRRDLSREERDAIDALRGQLVEIRTIKAAHARKPE